MPVATYVVNSAMYCTPTQYCNRQAAFGTLNSVSDQISDASITHSISLLCGSNNEGDHCIADSYVSDITSCIRGSKGFSVTGSPERKNSDILKRAAEDCLLPQEGCYILWVLCKCSCRKNRSRRSEVACCTVSYSVSLYLCKYTIVIIVH